MCFTAAYEGCDKPLIRKPLSKQLRTCVCEEGGNIAQDNKNKNSYMTAMDMCGS